ncbi:TetR family transcriptional regulator [Actinocorallia herbida]|uniref:TetR family transcriptional regulator n=1 Tax=Actinocorallia herbida TaxID=58109 RepID=A0A3N1CW49_9ACTN|nr:TetR/AcrR family transcriptional regulator [Actinocorallia herbida]ROO84948.1 TetR family transcriptional regulator [Actinocorallia herbida]
MIGGTPARRGRRRSEESRLAILTAAYELVLEVGYGALTVEGIAARAGCGKQTVYRWWPRKADVLMEALAVKADLRISTGDHGSYRADLHAFLRGAVALSRAEGVAPVLRALMAEAQIDPEFGARFRAGFLDRRRAALAVLLDRARERGDLPARPAPELVADLVFGLVWYRLLATDRPLAAPDADTLITLLTEHP